MIESWALEAIETEAMKRARRELNDLPFEPMVFGMTVAQVKALQGFFITVTGAHPADLKGETILEAGTLIRRMLDMVKDVPPE